MTGMAKIWEVKQETKTCYPGGRADVYIAVKNTGATSDTLWVYATYNDITCIRYRKMGIPPGRVFKWLIARCGTYTNESINIHIEAGHGWRVPAPADDTYDVIIEASNPIHYIAGEETGQENYTLKTNVDGEGAVSLNPPFGIYAPGTEVRAFAVRQWGWTFEKWIGDIESTMNPIIVVMDKNKTITAKYKQN